MGEQKRALVTGVTGMDGAYLSKLLLENGYEVFGAFRRTATPNFWRLQEIKILDKVKLVPCDLTDPTSIYEAISVSQPDEIYNLAAQSFVGSAFEQPLVTTAANSLGVTSFLEAIRFINPKIKMYQASTSEMYGNATNGKPMNEDSPFHPASPYGASKLYSHWMTKIYQKGYNMFVCSGILMNHEGELRGLDFVTRKISNEVAKIYLDVSKELVLGNVNAVRDWGYAPEFVKAMYLMMQQEQSDSYVVATGEAHTVLEFVQEAFDIVGLNHEDYLRTDKRFMRPLDVNFLLGDYSKAKEKLGWEPKVRFKELVKIMVNADIKRWQRALGGEIIPWDAPLYPSEASVITRALKY